MGNLSTMIGLKGLPAISLNPSHDLDQTFFYRWEGYRNLVALEMPEGA